MILSILRHLRHGPLYVFNPVWLVLGRGYRKFITALPGLKNKHYINQYGPFKLDAKFAFSNFKQWGHGHNEGFVNCIEECRGKTCVFDVGAHIGLVTLPMSQVVLGQVIAFEPAAANRKHLLNHLHYNHITNVTVQSCLVGSENKEAVDFFEQVDATGMNSRVVKKDHHLYHKTTHAQIKLDDFCDQHKLIPQVIKIDVEGAEFDVLLGAKMLLTTYSPVLYLSIHPKELSLMGSSVDQVINLLSGLHYKAFDIENREITDFRFSEYRFIKKELK